MSGAPADQEHHADPALLNRIAWTIRWRDRDRSLDAARRALALAAGAGEADRFEAGLALRTLAWHGLWRGALRDATRDCEAAEERLRGIEAAGPALAETDAVRGVVLYSGGRYDLARDAVQRGYRRAAMETCPEAHVNLLTTESTVLRHIGRADTARRLLRAALDLATGFDRARVLHNYCRFHLGVGETDAALGMALGAVSSARRWDNRVILPYALEMLGTVHVLNRRDARAAECLAEALALARAGGDVRVETQILYRIGSMEFGRGRVCEAVDLFEEGYGLAVEIGFAPWQQKFCHALSAAYEALGDLQRALDAMKKLDGLRKRQVA